MTLKPNDLILRCYAERDGALWVAVCIDLGLAAQGDSLANVTQKLEEQIKEYVIDAVAGPDREFAAQFLTRRAPLSQRLRYHVIRILCRLHAFRNGTHRTFKESLPLVPA